MKKIYTAIFLYIVSISTIFAGDVPSDFLPKKTGLPGGSIAASEVSEKVVSQFISSSISYIAIIAVLSLMITGIMYMIAAGDEEKAKKAKKGLIWSLVGVVLSVSALGIINLLNNITI